MQFDAKSWVRFRFAKRMRMTAQEIKDEHRDSEGDPRLKAKLRQMRMARARQRMMAAIPPVFRATSAHGRGV